MTRSAERPAAIQTGPARSHTRSARAGEEFAALERRAGLPGAILQRCGRNRVTTSAASMAFHGFLAILPATIAALGLAGVVGLRPVTLARLVAGIGAVLPSAAASVLVDALRTPLARSGSIAALAAGTAVALWAAVEAMCALQIGLDMAFGVAKDRGFVGKRLVALPLLLVTIVLGGGAFGLAVLGDPLGHLLRPLAPALGAAFGALWDLVRGLGALAAIAVLVATFYAVGPNRSQLRWRWVSPGSLLATAGWLAASYGYSAYLHVFGSATRSYGTFAGVAVLLLWLFIGSLVVLVGAEVDGELDERRLGGSLGAPPPSGRRGS